MQTRLLLLQDSCFQSIVSIIAKKLQVKIFENGKRVYTSPSVSEIREYRRLCVDNLWDEVTRFEKPHNYYVDLSQALWDQRNELLRKRTGEEQ